MLLRTLKVKSKDHPDLPFVIINESDFDETKHKVIEEENVVASSGDIQQHKGEPLSADDPKHQSLARTSNPKNKKADAPDPADHQQG